MFLFYAAMSQIANDFNYRLYAIRANTNGTTDSFYVKFGTDSVFNSSEVYVQRTKEYYDQFYQPVYPNAFEKFFKGADNIWRNTVLKNDNIGVAAATSLKVADGIGYNQSSLGVVIQLTNKTTSVTLNKICGEITTNNSNLANNTTATFVFNNNLIEANDMLLVSFNSGSTAGNYIAMSQVTGTGTANISVRNVSGGALAEAIVIRFMILKVN